MASDPSYTFGGFVLDVPLRELRRGDEAVVLGPRLFELLKLLVEERHRVVPRAEIQRVVWSGRPTTAGVLPQAVHKLRDALEDGSGTVWFKSVRGVGYRFLPEVRTLAPVSASATAPAAPAAPSAAAAATAALSTGGRVRVGILPCLNQTGDGTLQWMCLGLPAMTAQILEADERLVLVGSSLMADYLLPSQIPAPAEPLADRVLRELGIDVVVQGRLTRQSGLLWLHGELVFSDGRRVPLESLRGPQSPSLSLRWAECVQSRLAEGSGATLRPLSPDPFAVEAFGRACELFLRGEYARARPLFQVVYDLHPDHPEVRLQLLRTRVVVGDRQAERFGEELLALLAQQGARPATWALAHVALALAYLLCPGADRMARVHEQFRLGLGHCAGQEDQDWALMVRLNAAVVHGRDGDSPKACVQFDEVIRLSRRAGNLKRLAQALTGVASCDRLGGRLELARQRLQEALGIWQQVYHARSVIHTELSLAEVEGQMGEFDSAVEHVDRALGRLAAEGMLPYLAASVSNAAAVFLDRLDEPRVRQARSLFGEEPDREAPLVETGVAGLDGLLNVLGGDDEAAVQAWLLVHDKACVGNGGGYGVWRTWTVPLLRLAVRTGRESLCGRLESAILAHPAYPCDAELCGVVAHLQASRALAKGDLRAACAALAVVAHRRAAGREPALAALDLVWLHLEADRLESAAAVWSELGPWRDQHALGRLVHARLRQAMGDEGGVSRHHAAALALIAGGRRPDWARRWPDGKQPAPRFGALPSALHFPTQAS